MCTYTGSFNQSTAEPGLCTNTGGYIANAELDQIVDSANNGFERFKARTWHDDKSDSDIMVYGSYGEITTWVAYMNDTTKNNRIDWVKGLNFGGVSDWAIDLASWNSGIDPDSQDAVDLEAELPKGCPSDAWPDNLDDLNNMIDSIDTECQGQAVVHVLLAMVGPAISDYKDALKDFDEYVCLYAYYQMFQIELMFLQFGYYEEWVRNRIDDSLKLFMWSDGRKYMDCKWSSKDSSGSGPCTDMLVKQGQPGQGTVTVTYKMRDEDGFYKALTDDYGIDKDWIKWVDIGSEVQQCHCPDLKHNCPDCTREPDANVYHNWPQKIDDNSKIKITNPKSVIEAAIPNISDLSTVMLGTYAQMRLEIFDADDADVATAFSMPVFMLGDATDSIKEIKKIGKQQKEADDKAKISFILDIVSIVLMIIPFAGEAAEAIGGVANVARAAMIIGEAGNAAITVADIVEDPTSAPFAILGLLMGANAGVVGKGTKGAFTKASAVRKAMSTDTLKSFSDTFRKNDDIVQNIIKACRG
jgi:chitinase